MSATSSVTDLAKRITANKWIEATILIAVAIYTFYSIRNYHLDNTIKKLELKKLRAELAEAA